MRIIARHSWIGVLAFTAGVVGEFVSMLTARARWGGTGLMKGSRRLGPISMRQAIFGHTKRDVAFRLGPPKAAVGSISSGGSPFWHANTWYYAFDPRRQTALVVRFSEDRVVGVDFFRGMESTIERRKLIR